jgi:hypothetical protein
MHACTKTGPGACVQLFVVLTLGLPLCLCACTYDCVGGWQEELLQELSRAEADAFTMLDSMTKYYFSRAKLASKARPPHPPPPSPRQKQTHTEREGH